MKLATLPSSPLSTDRHPAIPDARLVVVSTDLRRAVDASEVAPSLIDAIGRWDELEPALRALSDGLEAGDLIGFGFDPTAAPAPLARAPHCLAGPLAVEWAPTDRIRAPSDDLAGYRIEQEIDFNAGFGVIVDEVPPGATAAEAATHIRLLVLLSHVRLRAVTPRGTDTDYDTDDTDTVDGATALAPVAVTPDELGPAWSDHRIHRPLAVRLNGQCFGHPNGASMAEGFHQLVARCAAGRRLAAGTLICSCPVSDPDPASGWACIADRRAWEQARWGEPSTAYLTFGDRVRLNVDDGEGRSIFGPIDQVCQPLALPGSTVPAPGGPVPVPVGSASTPWAGRSAGEGRDRAKGPM